MLCHGRIDVSEDIDVNKTSASKGCDICHYWYYAITDIIFNDFLILYQIFFSPQVKRSVIISNKHSKRVAS